MKGGYFWRLIFFFLLPQRNAIGVRETRAGSKQSSACHTHTHAHTAPSNTRHGNGTAAIRGEEPFPSIEGEMGERNERTKERASERERERETGKGGGEQRNSTAQEGKRESGGGKENTIKR